MDFSEPEYLSQLRDSLRKFLDAEASPETVAEWDRNDKIPLEIQAKFAELGVCAVTVPEEYGGVGHDVAAMITTIEMLASRSLALAGLYIMVACYGGLNIAGSGSENQKRRFLPAIAQGQLRLAYGLSEPDVGADLASVTTRVERHGDKVIINGAKRWCSGAEISDYIFLLCRSDDPDARYKNLSIVLVPPDTPGVSITPIEVMGSHGISTTNVYLDNVEVPFDLVLGEEAGWNNGWTQLTGKALEAEKLEVPALALGVAEAAFAEAWQYSGERKQFGKPISSYQSIRHVLADCKTKLQACRLMLYWCAWLSDSGQPTAAESSMTKLFVTENAKDIVLACQQVLGAYGYAKGFGMERYVRDVLALPIYGGSSAIQRNNITARLNLPR